MTLATPEDLAALERLVGALDDKQKAELVANIPGVKERVGATCHLTQRQVEADHLLQSDATHCMLFGGSRSGKTFMLVREIIARALLCKSRHAILRFRFSHVINSIAYDTLPKVLEICYPGAAWSLDKSHWIVKFDNGSEIWFGGLDEKERTEKILGQEFATVYLNECSQIPLSSRQIALTRLAQKTDLPRKMLYDCNPPSKRHWTHMLFIDKIDPARNQPLLDPENYASLQVNPEHNRQNLDAAYLRDLDTLPDRERKRFLLGVFADDDDSALWTPELLDKGRILDGELPQMQRIVVAVDPSGCSGPEDRRSDEVGIVVCGIGDDGQGYVLEDLSDRMGPEKWKTVVVSAYDRYGADAVVAETNYGGAMVKEVIRTGNVNGLPLAFREVKASRGKVVRAEPISALFQQGKVSLMGRFPELEYQLCAMTLAGYMGDRSPDRADAMIWGLTALFPGMARKERRSQQQSRVVLGYAGAKRRR